MTETASEERGAAANKAGMPDGSGNVSIRPAEVRTGHTRTRLIVFGTLATAIVLVAIFAEWIVPYDPYAQDLSISLQAPSLEHPAGTDRYGRDLLSRIIMGAQASLSSTFALVAIITVLGTAVGVIAGWYGGIVDTVLMRTADVFLAFPGLVLALAVASVLGGGMQNAVIAMSAIAWPKYARLSRSLVLTQKGSSYIAAARLSGCGGARLMFGHILPNMAGTILVTSVLDIGSMMMELAGLSFLGLGAQAPTAEWGSMMSDSRSLLQTAPWTMVGPGVAIFTTVVVFNLLGDTLRDWIDPGNRGPKVKRGAIAAALAGGMDAGKVDGTGDAAGYDGTETKTGMGGIAARTGMAGMTAGKGERAGCPAPDAGRTGSTRCT